VKQAIASRRDVPVGLGYVYTLACEHELTTGAAYQEGHELDCRSCDPIDSLEDEAERQADRFAEIEPRVRPEAKLGDHRPGIDPPIGHRRRGFVSAYAAIGRRDGRPLEGGIIDRFPSGWDGPGWYVELDNGGWRGAFESRSEAVEWARLGPEKP
jgi:hypothetical protein